METSRLIQNFIDQKRRLLIGSASVISGIAILIGYFQSGPTPLAYAKAETAYSKWKATPQNEELYLAMKAAISSVPALEKKYEASIAQKLLNTDKINEAVVMAHRSLERVKNEAPFHATYAQTTLLIEQGLFQQALEKAVALKEQMGSSYLSEFKGGSLLYAHNLLRIACLHQQLQNRPGEKAAWEEVEKVLQENSPIAAQILSSFPEKHLDLTHYIKERKKSL